jgi:hypothetical protein
MHEQLRTSTRTAFARLIHVVLKFIPALRTGRLWAVRYIRRKLALLAAILVRFASRLGQENRLANRARSLFGNTLFPYLA